MTVIKTFKVQCYECEGSNCGPNLTNMTTVTCEASCWAVSYFDNNLGFVWEEYGCSQSYCDSEYRKGFCTVFYINSHADG